MTPESLRSAIHTARVGDTLYIYDAETADVVHAEISRRMHAEGVSRVDRDGTREFCVDEVVFDPTKAGAGSAAYQWDRSGNRCKHERVRYRVTKDGATTRTVEKIVYRKMD